MFGGLLTIIKELKVRKIIISKQNKDTENYKLFKQIVKEKRINVLVVNAGDYVQIEKDIYFKFLWPENNNLVLENVLNNNSIVCKMQYKRTSVIFTGDIEEIAEKQILEKYKTCLEKLNSTILKVAHHGSITSSTEEFLRIVNPKIALIGVGKDNKFGHPDKSVIKRLKDLDIKIFRTDKMGEIEITIDKQEVIKVKQFISNL